MPHNKSAVHNRIYIQERAKKILLRESFQSNEIIPLESNFPTLSHPNTEQKMTGPAPSQTPGIGKLHLLPLAHINTPPRYPLPQTGQALLARIKIYAFSNCNFIY